MHVAFLATPDLGYVSGSSLSLRYTVEALARRGVQCTVLCQRAPGGPAVERVVYRELPMPLDYQVITDTTPTSADLADCLNHLVRAVVDLPRVDVMHAIYGTFTGVAAVVGAALLQVPVVITTFGRDVTLGAAVDARYRQLMAMAYGHVDLVVASDDDVAGIVGRHYCGPRSAVCVLPPGVNFRMIRQVVAGGHRTATPGTRVLTVQSSFNPQKGLAVLLEAFAAVVTTVPDAELVVAGHDDTPGSRIHADLLDRAARLGVVDRVRFVGHLPHRDVIELMTTCDLLVDPRTINSFSSCIFEAMASGLALVASAVPCNVEALGGGERGGLAAPGDPAALASAVLAALTDPSTECRRVAGRKFVERAAARVDCEVVARALHDRYLGLVDDRGRAS